MTDTLRKPDPPNATRTHVMVGCGCLLMAAALLAAWIGVLGVVVHFVTKLW